MIKGSEMSISGGEAVIGVVRDIGTIYADGTPRLEIHIPVGGTGTLQLQLGARVPVRLRIGEHEVQAGLRATQRNKYAWICPDVYLTDHIQRTLGSVLVEAGFSPKDRVRLTIDDDLITLAHECPRLLGPPGEPQRPKLEKAPALHEPPQPGAPEKFIQLDRYLLKGEHNAIFRAQFNLVCMDLVLATLAAAGPDPALSALAGVRGVYFLTMRLGPSVYKIYVGKTTSLPRRLADYGKAFQVHATNDFKLRALQDFMWQHFPAAAFDLYFTRESELGYTLDETAAVRLYRPLVNERAKKNVDARLAMQQACESHYAAVFAQKVGKA
jgi:hypothetical protein